MKKLLALVLAFSALAASAKTFEGTFHMNLTDGRSKTTPLTYSVKDQKIRTDIQADRDTTAVAILDFTKMEMIMLMPGQNMYMVMPIKDAVEQATGRKNDDITLEKTSITEDILGYTTTKYISKSKDGVTEIWATEELGTFKGLGNDMGRGRGKANWEKALVGKDFFPLRVVHNPGKRDSFRMEVTSVEPKTLPDAHFAPPAGYQRFDMGGMLQNLPFKR